ncbi:MAG: hypothetical protein NXI17_16475 [Alphaproteobacteria bacterium]|nr:hypothetical protein [Alphaproteobacteria bacterium]
MQLKLIVRKFAWIAVFCLALIGGSFAQSGPEQQLAGRTLDVMVGFSNTGGGARFWNVFSQELRKRLPATPVRTRFNDTGSGVDGTSDLFGRSKGVLAIGFVRPPEIAFAQLNERADVDFDFRQAQWIAGVEVESFIMAARRGLPWEPDVLRTLEPQTILPVSDILATHATVGILLNAVTGIPSKIVIGFKKSDRLRSLLAADVDFYTIAADAKLEPLLASGDIKALYTITGEDFPAAMGAVEPLESFLVPDAPASVVAFIKSARGMGRAFYAPPSVADEDVAALRSLFHDILSDPDFVERAAQEGVPVAAVASETVEAQLQELLTSDPAQKLLLDTAYACGLAMSRGKVTRCDFSQVGTSN